MQLNMIKNGELIFKKNELLSSVKEIENEKELFESL